MTLHERKLSTGAVAGLGAFLILAGLVANRWLLTRAFSPDRSISATNGVIIDVFDLVLISAGILVIRTRRKLAPHLRLPWAAHVLLGLAIALAGLGALEGALRLWLSHFASDMVFGTFATRGMMEEKRLRYDRHPYLLYVPSPGYRNADGDRHNSLGFRGEEVERHKPPGRYRIVALGGSTTYGVGVKTYREAYPYVLERELRNRGCDSVEVINAGVGDYDSWPILINFLFRVLDLQPDMVIYYEGTNEVETRMVFPFEAYRSDNTGRVSPPEASDGGWIDRFVLLRILLYPTGLVRSYADIHRLVSASTFVGDAYYDQLLAKDYPSGVFRGHPAIDILEHNKPEYTDRNLRSLIAVAREFKVIPVLVSFTYLPLTVKTRSDVYQRGISEHNVLVQGLCRETGAPFFDLASAMPREARYWTGDGVHLNAEGCALEARLLADFLAPMIPTNASRAKTARALRKPGVQRSRAGR